MNDKRVNHNILIYVTPTVILSWMTLFLLFLPIPDSFSQEHLNGLQRNPEVAAKNPKKHARLKSAQVMDTLDLPFLDDFSSTSVFPDSRFWIDKKAYVNSSYAVNPPSLGVATLDAIDETGSIYPNASSSPFHADELTSKPIRLNSSMEGVILSFFYQAGGIGDVPDATDSLIVDFYRRDINAWITVFSIPGEASAPFKQVMIPVGKDFCRKGFQFRFRNIASLDASPAQGRHGDCDFWNIDYVRLSAGRSMDEPVRDLAIQTPQTTLLKTYYSMPWEQFKKAFQTIIKPTIAVGVVNNHPDSIKYAKSPTFEFRELGHGNEGFYTKIDGPGTNIPPSSSFAITTDLTNPFQPNFIDPEIKFEVKSFISTNTSDFHGNDTSRYIQVFSNYFSYDDGTAETGYGVWGQGTSFARIAYAFTAYKPDTLSGISIYFNSTEKDTSLSNHFSLAVWKDNQGEPGDLLYIQSGDSLSPKKSTLNNFYTFALDSGIVVSGKFYIGWVQTSEDFLNVGMDLNNNNHDKLFYNIYGTWQNSEVNGTLMMHPVFGKASPGFPKDSKAPAIPQDFVVFPNPAQNLVNIQTEEQGPWFLKIYNLTGKLLSSCYIQNKIFDVSQYPDGLYIVQISSENSTFAPVKLLIQR